MDRISALLAQFPGPVRLAVSRLKWLAYMVVAAGFTVGAVDWIIEPGSRHVILGWFGAIIFSAGTVAAAVMMVPGASELALDGNGLTLRMTYRDRRWRWTDLSDFAVVDDDLIPRCRRVGFNERRAHRSGFATAVKQFTDSPRWRDVVLTDSYGGLSVDDCVRLLSLWQQRALSNAR
jgi:hypothetical protein